jgi:hypothetical protein
MLFGEVHVQHRLVHALVTHPRYEPPRVHAERCGVSSEAVATIPSSA